MSILKWTAVSLNFFLVSSAAIILAPGVTIAMSEKASLEDCLLCSFDFESAQSKYILPKELHEASGLSVTSDGHILVHGDEKAYVHALDPATGEIDGEFAIVTVSDFLRGDFEGVASTPVGYYLISSAGVLHRVGDVGETQVKDVAKPRMTFDTGLGEAYEIEGLTYYPPGHSLMIAVKTIYDEEDPRGLVIFEWSFESSELTQRTLSVSKTELKRHIGKSRYRSSGITYDEESGHFLLVSARNKMLIEISGDGAYVAGFKTNKKFHNKPEGLALLDRDGERFLIIADEGGKGKGSLTIYGQRKGK